jgi:hypothetical protein
MLNFEVQIPELHQLPAEKSGALLKECLDSPEFGRRTRRARFLSYIVWLVLVLAPPLFLRKPLAETTMQTVVFVALALLGLAVVAFVVPFFTHPRILRRLIRERMRDASL